LADFNRNLTFVTFRVEESLTNVGHPHYKLSFFYGMIVLAYRPTD